MVSLSTQSPQREHDQHHLCIVTETYPPEVNGVALTLARLVQGLLARGHAVSVVRPRTCLWLSDNPQPKRDTPDGPAVTLVQGVPFPGYKGLRIGLPAGRQLQDSWTQDRPAAVYVATQGPLGWSAVRIARRLRIPVLSGFHTNFHTYSEHYRLGWFEPVILRYLRTFHNRTRGTLVPSDDLRDRLHTQGFHNVRVLSRGIDSQRFTPQRRSSALRSGWGLSTDDLAVLYVGRLAAEKNLDLAVQAYRAMQQSSTTPALKFILVGDGPLSTCLQKDHPDLVFCGVQTGERLAAHYASADIFLFPSQTETFGNVTLEAMASGLAVVAYDYAAAKMHITHTKTGLLVPYGNTLAFIDTAVKIAHAPQLLSQIRCQVRPYVDSLTWPRIVEQFEALLLHTHDTLHTHTSDTVPDTDSDQLVLNSHSVNTELSGGIMSC